MSNAPMNDEWWQASDGLWYPPQAQWSRPGADQQAGGVQQQLPWMPYGPPLPAANTKATAALVTGIVGLPLSLLCGVFGVGLPIAAIVLGHQARAQIRVTGQQGWSSATSGMIMGYVGAALMVLIQIIPFGLGLAGV